MPSPRRRTAVWAAAVALLVTGGVAQAAARGQAAGPGVAVPTPTVTGPITGGLRGRPQMASYYDLATKGYLEEEYFIAGTATATAAAAGLPDGTVPPAAVGDKADYVTRILVRRPADERKFNGTVLVDWLNVTAQTEADPAWAAAAERLLMPQGWVYVGVSAQKVGVDGYSPLSHKNWDPVRYMPLKHPGDAYSYDIFTQAAKAIWTGKPLGGVKPTVVIGTGNSQSGGFMNKYLSGIYTKDLGVYSGFAPSAATVSATKIPVPTVWINSQSETSGSPSVPDNPLLRVWEVAGANHADDHVVKEAVLARAAYDVTGQPAAGGALVATASSDYQAKSAGQDCPAGRTNLFPYRYGFPPQLAMLERWVRTGKPAPAFPRQARDTAGKLVYDADGNVKGGLRLPVMEVPVAKYTTVNCGNPLDGTSVRFTEARLRELYPSHDVYLAKLTDSAKRAVDAGMLFPADAVEMLTIARGSTIPDVE